MDVLGLATMKDAANCDKQHDLQNSENQQIFERIRRFKVSLKCVWFSVPFVCFVMIHYIDKSGG